MRYAKIHSDWMVCPSSCSSECAGTDVASRGNLQGRGGEEGSK